MGQSIEVQDRDEHGVWKEIRQWLPSGKNMLFIPNILDTRFIVTEKTKMKVKKSVSKQKYFL